jgi:hypothetical protein
MESRAAPEGRDRGRKSRWRRTFDAVERPIARRLEGAVQSSHFADALALGLAVDRTASKTAANLSSWVLHRVNLPAASDIKALLTLLHRLEGQMEHTAASVERLELQATVEPSGGPSPPSKLGRATTDGDTPAIGSEPAKARVQRPRQPSKGKPAEPSPKSSRIDPDAKRP